MVMKHPKNNINNIADVVIEKKLKSHVERVDFRK